MKSNYKIGDVVTFKTHQNTTIQGTIYVVDTNSVEFPNEITYDILGADHIFYKKVHNTQILKTLI